MTSQGSLHIFDIDDTLFRTTARMRVVDSSGNILSRLTSDELKKHSLSEGELYDVTEFTDAQLFHDESIPIDSIVDNFKRIHAKVKLNFYPGSEVIVLTARSQLNDRELFYKTFRKHGMDIDSVATHCVGDPPGIMQEPPSNIRKQAIIRTYLKRQRYSAAFMYDDTLKNLVSFLQLRNEFPSVSFYAYLAKPDGLIAQINPEMVAA